jgi:hypothetical protein
MTTKVKRFCCCNFLTLTAPRPYKVDAADYELLAGFP